MPTLGNFDLLSVSITVAATLVLGFAVFWQNPKSLTSKYFLAFSLITAIWGTVNYLNYQTFFTPTTALFFLRLTIALGVWHAYTFYKLATNFPQEQRSGRSIPKIIFLLTAITSSILNMTPISLRSISALSPDNRIISVENGPGMALFGFIIFTCITSGVVVLLKKFFRAQGEERKQHASVLIGVCTTFVLILYALVLSPTILNDPRFIPLGAVFIFPFIFSVSYAILRHKLFNVRVIGVATLVFVLAVITFSEIILATNLTLIIYRSIVFILVLVFGILLLRSVLHEIALRERMEGLAQQLAVANEELKKLDQQKTEFVSIASHQLRSPLTAIKGYTSMILEGSFGKFDEKVKGALDVIFQSSQKLVNVIEDFLNITRIELGRMKYEMSNFDLKQLVELAAKELTLMVESRGLRLKLIYDRNEDFHVTADSGKISQVVNNLIDNATKYSKAGEILISLEKIDGKIRFSVKDQGAGMSPETIGKLFNKFVRADGAGQLNVTGTGLGLYVAKQIIEAHGGKIWAESAGEGKGSTFIVEL